MGSAEGVAGETGIVIPVSLTANGDNIAGIDMTVSFSTASQYASLAADCSTQTVSENIYASCFVSDNVVTIRLAETSSGEIISTDDSQVINIMKSSIIV